MKPNEFRVKMQHGCLSHEWALPPTCDTLDKAKDYIVSTATDYSTPRVMRLLSMWLSEGVWTLEGRYIEPFRVIEEQTGDPVIVEDRTNAAN